MDNSSLWEQIICFMPATAQFYFAFVIWSRKPKQEGLTPTLGF